MSNTISASVSKNFELTVSPSEGFTGEHNAEMLEINISPLVQSGFDYYIIIFDDMSVNGVKKSNEIRGREDYPAYLDNESVFCPLSAQQTSTGKLKIQIEAHRLDSESSVIKKTSVAGIEFKPSIMSGNNVEFDSSSVSRLDNLENRIAGIESTLDKISERLEQLSIIPLAKTDTSGGFRLAPTSPIQLDENGAAIFDYSKSNSVLTAIRLIFELLPESDSFRTLYVKNCEETPNALDGLTFDLNLGNHSHVLFCTETAGKIKYCNGNYDAVELDAKRDTIYLFSGHEASFNVTEYNQYSFRKLLLEGVK